TAGGTRALHLTIDAAVRRKCERPVDNRSRRRRHIIEIERVAQHGSSFDARAIRPLQPATRNLCATALRGPAGPGEGGPSRRVASYSASARHLASALLRCRGALAPL